MQELARNNWIALNVRLLAKRNLGNGYCIVKTLALVRLWEYVECHIKSHRLMEICMTLSIKLQVMHVLLINVACFIICTWFFGTSCLMSWYVYATDIVEEMMKKKMAVKAVDIACTFGMESRYPPQLCMQQFLKQSSDTVMEERKVSSSDEALVCTSFQFSYQFCYYFFSLIQQLCNSAQNEANKKYSANLKSALKCLVDHKIDPHIPGWNIPLLISGLKRSITRRNRKIKEKVTQKREADEPPESLKNLTSQEVKRTQLSHNSYVDGKSSSEGLIPTNLLNGGIRGHNASFSASSSGLHVPQAGPYPGSGVHGGMPVDSVSLVVNTNGQPYGWRGDAPSRERLIGCSYADSTPSMIGHMGGYNVGQVDNNYFQPNVWHGNAPLRERVIGHSHPEPAPLGVNGVFRVSPSIEGFVGLLNPSSTSASSRKPDSGLYGFADTVI